MDEKLRSAKGWTRVAAELRAGEVPSSALLWSLLSDEGLVLGDLEQVVADADLFYVVHRVACEARQGTNRSFMACLEELVPAQVALFMRSLDLLRSRSPWLEETLPSSSSSPNAWAWVLRASERCFLEHGRTGMARALLEGLRSELALPEGSKSHPTRFTDSEA